MSADAPTPGVEPNASPSLVIDGTRIGGGGRPWIIAEISGNHRGGKDRALELVAAAAESGADAVKFQHFTPDTITVRSEHPDFVVGGGTLWDGRELADLYEETMTPWEWTEDLVSEAERSGLTWLSSPFDPSAVDYLERFDIPAFKISSFEITDLPLIRYAAGRGKPLIISTGMAEISEIDSAVRTARGGGASEIALLRCNSAYPAEPSEMDLRAIPTMSQLWSLPIGLSDHSIGDVAAVTAVALGACVIEKHLTLKRSDGGPDAPFSAEPPEFAALVEKVNQAHLMLGRSRFGPSERELASMRFRRSVRVTSSIKRGERVTPRNVRVVRPAGGLSPHHLADALGMTAVRDLDVGDPIRWSDLSGEGCSS